MAPEAYRLGTRRSALARVQAEMVRRALGERGCLCSLVEVESHGDADLKTPLYEMDPLYPGVFTKHLEQALLKGDVDLAVHSLKDLPTQQPAGLKLAAVSARETTVDRLLVNPKRYAAGEKLGLPRGATVGTSSLRREAQLLAARPDLKIVPLRGNVPTRIAAARDGKCDGVVLAGAGLDRLRADLSGVTVVDLPEVEFISAPAQGVVGIETRSECAAPLAKALAAFHDAAAFREASVERRILRGLDGGCTLPLGVRCRARATGEAVVAAFLGVSRDRKSGKHEWSDFKRFEARGLDDAELVSKVVAELKGGGA